MPTKIRKAVISEFGDVSKISVVDADIPDPPKDHVQVKVHYSGFSGADINMRQGTYPFQREAPLTPGYCLVGTVTINSNRSSTKFQPGDLVGCLTIYDAQSTLTNLPEKYLIPLPHSLDLQSATALILDWNTAYAMVKHSARISPGQNVFIHGMSGAVGYAITVLAQLQGAHVYGTASEKNHAPLRAIGATPFPYTNKDWIAHMHALGGAHAVFDALGFESWDESYSILRPNRGILVGYGGNLLNLTGGTPRSVLYPTLKLLARGYLKFWSAKRTRFYYIDRDQASFRPDLNALFELLGEGKIEVPIKAVYGLEDIREAHRSWGKAVGVGSVLIKIAGNDNV
jgi:synaptic vesicle membrane protein VAT-1